MFKTLADCVGGTALVRLQRLPGALAAARGNVVLAKLEGDNPAGSVKDRPALSMIVRAEERGDIRPGDTLIEATSGNTGIALAMAAAMRGYRMVLVMPENQSVERRQTMRAYGAELVLTPRDGGMELARDVAVRLRDERRGVILDQFANPDNPLAHYAGTGPEIWQQSDGRITHFVSSMGTTGTIMGVSRYLKEMNPAVCIVGCQPEDGSQIPGIRKWPAAYLPKIFDRSRVDRVESVNQAEAEETTRRLARDVAVRLRDERRGVILDQFANPDNPLAHYEGTGPEIWRQTDGQVTHFVSSMGTTGTIMGVSRYLKEVNPAVCIVGCQPEDGSQIPGIRKWPEAYLPKIFDRSRVDRIESVNQAEAEETTRRLAREEGIFAGVSSGGALAVALRLAAEVENATIVSIVCDRGDRYLSTGVFPA